RIIEIGRYSDDGFIHLLPQVVFSRALELLENHGGNFRWRVLLTHDFDTRIIIGRARYLVRHHLHLFADFVITAAHEPFNRIHGVLRIRDRLTFGDLPYQTFAAL